ncbi:penicillin acylase family protein [Hoeflea sp. G2-23]|uniref:Penicillin acylase family protein n=1 Tax=Hoeflea algicola TaxID=2983763 RepID=A0ABT3ZF39_9HYPH|nr:penicillin acylase family protein [Hoeflea algicola]MCY0150412.1 penicillin acylase family protein [Hoeflea algicola]
MHTTPHIAFRLSGLESELEILIDRWGVPHVFAGSDHDAFFGQGFAVARDRLWQIDLWRKRGLGQLANDFGPAFIEADRAARLLLYRGNMDAEWESYGADARAITEAFVAGINAFIGETEKDHGLMPVEFVRTGTRPALWCAEDCVRIRSHGPLFNLVREITRSDVINTCGVDAEAMRRRLEPEWTLQMPEGLGLEPIPSEVRRIFELGTAPPNFNQAVAPTGENAGGSNNWAITAARTTTGRPILASDPHRTLSLPSLRYVSHLNAPGLDVIGAGEPAVPGIAIGHNQTSAFCFTIHVADQSDLYIYELHPDDPELYRFEDRWERMSIVSEEIPVKDGEPETVSLAFTIHGPMLFSDPSNQRAYAMRSIWSEPGSAPYLGALRYQKVDNWDDFVEARSHWRTPTLNHVYADTSGDIGWIMSGFVPVRAEWDGLMPVPGDGSREWRGFMAPSDHPKTFNPECGWVATANEMNLPADFDYRRHKSGFEWCDPCRYEAIARKLDESGTHSIKDSISLQTSFASPTAERLTGVVANIDFSDPDARQAKAFFSGWSGSIDGDSGPAMLFEIWFRRHLLRRVAEHCVPGSFDHFSVTDIAAIDTMLVTELMESPDARFGEAPEAARNLIVGETLAAAWREAVSRGGADCAKWQWDSLHHSLFLHPLSSLLGDDTLNTRRVAKGGSGLTPNAADYDPDTFAMTVGASFRMVLDIGGWDDCVFINAPGQSGDPRSRHYDDHLDPWGREAYLPMLFSRYKIEAATQLRIRCIPESAPISE